MQAILCRPGRCLQQRGGRTEAANRVSREAFTPQIRLQGSFRQACVDWSAAFAGVTEIIGVREVEAWLDEGGMGCPSTVLRR